MEKEFHPDINNGEGIFGLPFSKEEALVQIVPVPWDLTTSYGKGTSNGPQAIFDASFQLDLFRNFYPEFWKSGIFMEKVSQKLKDAGHSLYEEAHLAVEAFNAGEQSDETVTAALKKVNDACFEMNRYVYQKSIEIINSKKLPIVLGGDHSSPLGLLTALSETNESFGILHIDAHADLRKNYQGFVFSHASIMYNALRLTGVNKIVQLGIRDYCTEEDKRIVNSSGKIISFTDRYLQHELFEGSSWMDLSAEIVNALPSKVYVSFDIDGLDPAYCPNTGTPVPGGPSLAQVMYLIETLCESGRKIIGADLCEVCPHPERKNEWDANVGARALFDMCMYMVYSNNR